MTQPTPDPRVELTLFGPPRLRLGGSAVRLGSRKALALCIVLALDGARTREQLTALLWPDFDPVAGRRNLRRDLFRLREAGLALEERDDGAVALAAAAELPDAVHAGAEPLQGLDGLAGDDFQDWLARSRAALEWRRSARLRERALEAQRRGDDDEALRLLDALLAADPCDEAAALQAVTLLQQRGQPAQAAAWVRRVAEALQQRLQLPVSAALREAVGGVAPLPQATPPAPPAPPAGPAPLIRQRVPYVRRTTEHEQVRAAWARGQRVYLSGAAGVGKSRLAQELAASQGGWLRLACEPNDALVPYAAAVRALRTLREAAPDVELPGWVRRELAQLLPELGPPPSVRETDESRARLLAAFSAAFSALVADNFKALVFDDWHWVDVASLELWATAGLAPGVLVLVVYRSAQLPPAALRHQRAEVDSGRAISLVLDGLDEGQTLALVRALSGSAGGALFSRRLHRSTAGNPFFLLETLRHLQQLGLLGDDPGGGWRTPFDEDTADYAELPVPPTVRDAVQLRVRALGETARRLLEAASLLGERFEVGLLADATTLDEAASIAALEHAAAAQLVVADGAGWRFAHDLVRQCLAEGLGAARRRVLHQRFAHSLQRHDAPGALVALHRERAGELDAARRGYVAAAESALRVHALRQALAHWADALRCRARGGDAVAIHLACAAVHARCGDPAAAEAALDAAAAAADDEAGPARLQVLLARAEAWAAGRTREALDLLEGIQPMVAHLPPPLQAQALKVRARVLTYAERLPEAGALLRQAIALQQGVPGLEAERAEMLDTLARMSLRAGDLASATAAADEAVALLETGREPARTAYALVLQAVTAIFAGQVERARALLLRARELARRCGEVPAHRNAILNLVKLATDAGDVAQAGELLDEGEALAPGFEHVRAEQAFLEARYFVHYLRGELDAARASARRLIDAAERVAAFGERIGARHVTVDLFLLAGELATARELLDQAQQLCDAQRAGTGGGHFLAQQAAKMAWLRLAEGSPAEALALLEAAPAPQRLEDQIALSWTGAAAALDLGDPAAARAWLDRGVPPDGAPTDQTAMWLLQRLRLAAREPAPDDELQRERARALAASGRLPAQMAGRLRAVLAG